MRRGRKAPSDVWEVGNRDRDLVAEIRLDYNPLRQRIRSLNGSPCPFLDTPRAGCFRKDDPVSNVELIVPNGHGAARKLSGLS